MSFITEKHVESLLECKMRELIASDGTRMSCTAFVVLWRAYDELIQPPNKYCPHDFIDRALSMHRRGGGTFDVCFERIVTVFHMLFASPWSLPLVPRLVKKR